MALAWPTSDAKAQQSEAFELDWQAPSSCPQQIEVNEQIRAMLGAAPGATLPSGLRASGVIEPMDDRFRLTLTVRVGQTDRARVIASNDCTTLGKAAAVVLGLLIRRERESGRGLSDSDLGGDFAPPLSPTPTVEPSATPTVTEPLAPPQTHDAPTKRHWNLLVMLPTATLDYFTMPSLDFGVGAALGIQYGGWRWFVSGTLWRNERVVRAGLLNYQARFARRSFDGWICKGWRSSAFELSPCALAAVDVLEVSASGDRLTTARPTTVLASVGAGFLGSWHVTEGFGIFLSLSGRVWIRRSEFVVQGVQGMLGADQAHAVPWGTALTSIGGEWIF